MPLCRNVDLKSLVNYQRAGETVRAHRSQGSPVEKAIRCARNCLTRYVKNYVGDLNRKTTLNNTPVPSFVVTQLCAAQICLFLWLEPANADADWYSQDSKSWMCGIAERQAQHMVVARSLWALVAKAHWPGNHTAPTFCQSKRLKRRKRQQRCVREGDTVSLRGILACAGAQRCG